ncbi:MAG: Holliday junction branch migration DNA helicase RuvB [Campylobacterales bacterium]
MRVVELEQLEGKAPIETSFRPRSIEEYIGQRRIVENLKIFIEAARRRGEPLDHLLLSGPPGLGKTTLAQIVATEMGGELKSIGAPMLEKGGDLAAILTTLQHGDILFIDEIHRLKANIEELLYSAMEDFKLEVIVGSGAGAKTLQLKLPKFTLVGATTRSGMISNPLRNRFGIQFRLNFYKVEELEEILKRGAQKLGVELTPEGAHQIARRSRGTPRVALRLLRRLRDFAEVEGEGMLTVEIVERGLEGLGINREGLEELDLRFLEILERSRGAVGIGTLAAILGEEVGTLEEVVEPYLLAEGYIQKTPKGRIITEKGRKILNQQRKISPFFN